MWSNWSSDKIVQVTINKQYVSICLGLKSLKKKYKTKLNFVFVCMFTYVC